MADAISEALVIRPNNNRRPANKTPTRKDLIFVRSRQNGQVYKFACITCISGHRAPQCDPAKHKGKVLFRRPEPGRPAKVCGHAPSQGCDCKALRHLCCLLEPHQWAELVAGEIPTATMYDDENALDDAQKKERKERQAREQAQAQAQAHEQAIQAANMYALPQSSMPYRPAPHGMQFLNAGQITQHISYMPYMPLPQAPHDFYSNGFAPTTFEPAAYQPQLQPVFHPQYQNMMIPADTSSLQQYAAHMGQQEQIAAQPSANPSQSCCSSSRPKQAAQQFVQPTASPFNLPGPSPRSQFPCQSCASFQCTCITCPEVRQVPSGAWSQSCGRGGHIDNPVLPKQEYSSPQDPHGILHALPEIQSPLQNFSQQPQDPSQQQPQDFVQQHQDFVQQPQNFVQQPQDFVQQHQDFAQQPQDFAQQHQDFAQQHQDFAQQPQDVSQGLPEHQIPLQDFAQELSMDVLQLPEFPQFRRTPTFEELLEGDLSDITGL